MMNEQEKIDALIKFIEVNDINREYLKIAITCSNFASEHNITNQDSLAIVGDHVIKLIISSSEFLKSNNITKEKLHQLVDVKGTKENLEMLAIKLNLKEYLLYSNTDLDGNKKLATSLEAIFGAIFISDGFEAAKLFAYNIKLLEH